MSALSNYVEDIVIGWLGRNTDFPSAPDNVYVSLHTASPADTGANEVSGTGYARVAVSTGTNGTGSGSGFTAPSTRATENNAAIVFPDPGGSWGTVTHVGLWDASSGGNFLVGAALGTSRPLTTGDQDPQIASGDFDVSLNGSTYLGDLILKWMVRNTDMPGAPNSVYASLHSADPGATGASELSSTGSYARVDVTTGTAGSGSGSKFDAASGGTTTNNAAITFPTPTANWSAAATHTGLFDASTSGNFLVGAALAASQTVLNGDLAPSFAAGEFDIQAL